MRGGGLAAAWGRLAPGRRPHGIVALLLPYTEEGRVDWRSFEGLVERARGTGLDVAVNMDTGFGELLSPAEREAVLDATRRVLGPGVAFWAGAFADADGARAGAWRAPLAAITARGGCPVIVQSRAMHGLPPAEKAALYAAVAGMAPAGALAFELSPRFASHGEIWDAETFERLLGIDALVGAKHSSLDRGLELARLTARDRIRPGFRVHTGNDLAIDMVAYGSDWLLGLATFAPERFAARDALLAAGEVGFMAANDDLQHLGNVAFRQPIPAYKHAAAQFLHLTGALACDGVHPRAARRPQSDRVLLFDCAHRLGLLDDPERTWRERVAPFG